MGKYMLLLNVAENYVEPNATVSGIGFFFEKPESAREVYDFAVQYLEANGMIDDLNSGAQLNFFEHDDDLGDYDPTTFDF